ncbi:C45 family autoproteolytic acyltransferase/hydrolase [Jejudonia soesokkakensis]|uniref:C45 family autoproteolytic acyltransferase/hydrolase n=1 Tax=Jejudonia soesokkakensis TaxID=1323432 RepID=A0ABW2MWV9_9FLAO
MQSKIFSALLLLISLSSCGIKKSLNDRPDLSMYNVDTAERTQLSDSTFISENGLLTRNRQGMYELYVEGNPLERGLAIGALTQELMYHQEQVFFEKINALVPSKGQQKFLAKFLKWYNRKLYKHIPEEYKTEIYGLTRYASTDFNSIAEPYVRSLYLHGAHDIGHALQDLMLVGCTSFAVWDEKSEDGNLLIGRNFDFYAGDDFAENKIISFVKPDDGYKFMSVTWGGFIGVVSGMNDQGVTVTINAGTSKIPLVAKTPISIVTREILQYAATIEEAIEIAKKFEVFVSESIMIGSANDGKAVLIEVSPTKFDVFEVENSSTLICSNHFQSDAYGNDRRNLKTIKESHTQYRFDRMNELLTEEAKINPTEAVAILRNRKGINDTELGFGNEKALNQLLAHHGVVFQPADLKVWVSSNPYQLGEFVGYDLTEEFERLLKVSERFTEKSAANIPADPFLETEAYANYEVYRELETEVELSIASENYVVQHVEQLSVVNPEYWKAYYLQGRYYYETEKFTKAIELLSEAIKKEIPSLEEKKLVEKYLKKAKRKAS